MLDTLKKIYIGSPETSNATLYTVPASTKTIIKSITIANITTSDATLTLKAGGQSLLTANVITAGNLTTINDVGILEPGDLIEASQGTANAITLWVSGMEVA